VWKLKEEKTCEQYQSMVKDKVREAELKYFDVTDEKYNDGYSTGHMWIVKRPMQA